MKNLDEVREKYDWKKELLDAPPQDMGNGQVLALQVRCADLLEELKLKDEEWRKVIEPLVENYTYAIGELINFHDQIVSLKIQLQKHNSYSDALIVDSNNRNKDRIDRLKKALEDYNKMVGNKTEEESL